ncbi:mucin-like protein 1 [Coprinopsis cinerea AmutBmut pab1-1]|nr:mucin-like protein 1 [Coprinopsis cinerea AmutBmut pab1-1]
MEGHPPAASSGDLELTETDYSIEGGYLGYASSLVEGLVDSARKKMRQFGGFLGLTDDQLKEAVDAEDLEGSDVYRSQLDEFILLSRRSLCRRLRLPYYHPKRSDIVAGLAAALWMRFGVTGDLNDLAESISFGREALLLRPPGHPDRFISLSTFATSLSTRFELKGDLQDLEECITCHREALLHHPPGDPDRSMPLYNLANSLSTRFKHKGDFQDLEECIAYHQEVLLLLPPGHWGRYGSLNNLAISLFARFE